MDTSNIEQRAPFIIVGLGNPGEQYEQTPHNAGFDALNELHKQWYAKPWKLNKKIESEISKTQLNNTPVILAKPTTFMNNSGKAVSALMKYYKASLENIIIIHDDIDLQFGAIKIRRKGSSGGHRGVNSIINHLHTNEFTRIKIGVGFAERPINFDAKEYVLKKMYTKNRAIINESLQTIPEYILSVISIETK